MKKIFLIFALALSVICLASCGNNTPPAGDGGGNEPPADESSSELTAIHSDGGDYDLTDLISTITSKTGKMIPVKTGAEKAGREILIGDTDRRASQEAAIMLESAMTHSEWDMVGYIIYVRDGDIAVCWNSEWAIERALEQLGNIISGASDMNFSNGVKKVEEFSYIEAMEAEEAKIREAELDQLEALYGKDARDAMEKHLSIYGEEFYLWLANLYDPGEYDSDGNPLGGGFYYSNSARDTYGFKIDIESTMQVLNLLVNLDMVREYGSLKNAIPERMQKEMIAFAQSLQSPIDGYFYHPQWGTNIQTSRLSRDLGWATSLLSSFGAKPLYNAPNGTKGLYGDPPGVALTEPLQNSGVAAVSKVVATATNWPSQLATLDNWKSYINAYASSIRTNSYSIGNTIASQAAQISTREKEGIASGEIIDANGDGIAEDGFIMTVKNFFDKYQLENGVWAEGSVEKGTITYAATNGLMKISQLYDSLDLTMKYPEASFKAGLYIAMLEGPDCQGVEAVNSVYVYNAFKGMIKALKDLKVLDPAKHTELKQLLADNACELIRITSAKALKFKKADGSFGYSWTTSPDRSQGVPVAVPGTVEGSVNGGGGAYTAITNDLCSLLGITIRLQFQSDMEKFLHEVEQMVHVEKEQVIIPATTYTFEDEEIGSNVVDGVTFKMDSGYAEIANDPAADGAHGKVIKFVAQQTGKGDSLYSQLTGAIDNPSCYTAEFDMYFSEYLAGGNTSVFRMRLKGSANAYMLTMKYNNGQLVLGDDSESGVSQWFANARIPMNEWHKIRVEYYVGDASTVKIKVFLDGTQIATSTNYSGNKGDGSVAPVTEVTQMHIYSYYPVLHTTYFDNITVTATNDEYVESK